MNETASILANPHCRVPDSCHSAIHGCRLSLSHSFKKCSAANQACSRFYGITRAPWERHDNIQICRPHQPPSTWMANTNENKHSNNWAQLLAATVHTIIEPWKLTDCGARADAQEKRHNGCRTPVGSGARASTPEADSLWTAAAQSAAKRHLTVSERSTW